MNKTEKRKYNASVQAEIRALTHQRVLDGAAALFLEKWLDEMTLQDVAEKSGVTVQTLLRHFGSRDQLFITAIQEIDLGADGRRAEPQSGNVKEIVKAITDYYEEYGDGVLRCLAQEIRFPMLDIPLKKGRVQHRNWVKKVFAIYLTRLSGDERQDLEDQLYSLCEVYLWRIYRIDFKKSRAALEKAWFIQIKSVIESFGLNVIEEEES